MVLSKLRMESPTVVVDGGSLFWKSKVLRESERAQRLLKAELQAKVVARNGIDAMVPGVGDLALGLDEYARLTAELPVLSANLVCGERSWPGSVVVDRGGVKLGVIGVSGELHPDCTLSQPPLDALQAELQGIGEVDAVLVLAHVGRGFGNQAAQVAGVDFVLDGADGASRKHPLQEGSAWILGNGKRGKTLGVLKLEPVEGAELWMDRGASEGVEERLAQRQERLEEAQEGLSSASPADRAKYQSRVDYYSKEVEEAEAELKAAASAAGPRSLFSNELVPLNADVGEDTAILAELEALTEAIAALPPQVASAPTSMGPYVGSESCRGCHLEAWTQWAETPHARAYASLARENKELDASCYGCHVTGAFHPEGPQTPHEVGHLKNVGCESCHGPGRAHVADPKAGQMQGEPRVQSCTQCHDGVQDQGDFDQSSYWPRVVHTPQ